MLAAVVLVVVVVVVVVVIVVVVAVVVVVVVIALLALRKMISPHRPPLKGCLVLLWWGCCQLSYSETLTSERGSGGSAFKDWTKVGTERMSADGVGGEGRRCGVPGEQGLTGYEKLRRATLRIGDLTEGSGSTLVKKGEVGSTPTMHGQEGDSSKSCCHHNETRNENGNGDKKQFLGW